MRYFIYNNWTLIGSSHFGFDDSFVDCNVFLCNFHREQAWERLLSTVANGMKMYKAMVLVFVRRIAEPQTEINFENSIKDFMESEIWQHEHNKKLRDLFSKTWLQCHEVLFISVFMLMQSSFNHFLNQHYCSLQIFNIFVKSYIHLYSLGCHISSIFMLAMERNWKC